MTSTSKGLSNESPRPDSFSSDNSPASSSDDKNDDGNENKNNKNDTTTINSSNSSAQALSLKFMKSLSGLCCQECGTDPFKEQDDKDAPSELYNLQSLQRSSTSISPLVAAPMMTNPTVGDGLITVEGMIGEYMTLCQFYKVPYNAGVVTTLRFSLPSLRVSGSFHDLDMLAVVELLLRHANTKLKFISRLDFSIASKEGRRFKSYRLGFTSHGALALAKVLQKTRYIRQVWLPRHRIGPYGASALFMACRDNSTIQTLNLRRCGIGERGAFAFCELIAGNIATPGTATTTAATTTATATITTGLQDVDLSSNGIGHRGTLAIERAMEQQMKETNSNAPPIFVNLEGNLVFPEIMNGITHGLGVLLSLIGGYLLYNRVRDMSYVHHVSCAVYTISLLALYVSSTLYHSFYALQHAKYVFMVFDKCAIYILIAGTYTPFLQIMLVDKPIWSVGLLGFIWVCCFLGISVEAFYPTWRYRPMFSLAMYLGMGWACIVCLPEMKSRMPIGCIHLILLGGVGYTVGVPFFVRNNNLDHAIWHLFVMSGSIFHWFAIYLYVAPRSLDNILGIE